MRAIKRIISSATAKFAALLLAFACAATSATAWGAYTPSWSGKGTEDSPYEISSASELAELAPYFADPGKTTTYIRITSDIDYSEEENRYTPPVIGGSDTRLSGHTVYIYANANVTISNLDTVLVENSGLIGSVHESTKLVSIKNITLNRAEVNGSTPWSGEGTGAFIGSFKGETLVLENCQVKESRIDDCLNMGGLVGYCNANGSNTSVTFKGCSVVNSKIRYSENPMGGFVGYCLADTVTISDGKSSENRFDSFSEVEQSVNDVAGAFVGRLEGTETRSTKGELSDVTATGNKVVVGTTESTEIPIVAQVLNGSSYEVVETPASAVAKIGDTKYETLAEAIAAVPTDGTQTTITMIADVPDAVGISVAGGKNFIVDFGGHTYTVNNPGAGSAGTETSAFQLRAGSAITFKNGTINIAAANLEPAVSPAKNIKRIIQNYADLTLDNMVINAANQYGGEAYALSFNNGSSALINGTKIVTTSDDTVAFDVYDWSSGGYTGGAQLTIGDGVEINGRVMFDNSVKPMAIPPLRSPAAQSARLSRLMEARPTASRFRFPAARLPSPSPKSSVRRDTSRRPPPPTA